MDRSSCKYKTDKKFVLLNICCVNRDAFFKDSLMNRKFKRTAFIWNNCFVTLQHFNVTFDQFNTSLLNKSISY